MSKNFLIFDCLNDAILIRKFLRIFKQKRGLKKS